MNQLDLIKKILAFFVAVYAAIWGCLNAPHHKKALSEGSSEERVGMQHAEGQIERREELSNKIIKSIDVKPKGKEEEIANEPLGYLNSMKTLNIRKCQDKSLWSTRAFEYKFTTPENKEYMRDTFHLYADLYTWRDLLEESKSIKDHMITLFTWACIEMRRMVGSIEPENFADIQSRIKNRFVNTVGDQMSKELVTINCPLRFSTNYSTQIIPTEITKFRYHYEKSKLYPKLINFVPEIIVVLLDGKMDNSYFSYQPMDMIEMVEGRRKMSFVRNVFLNSEGASSSKQKLVEDSNFQKVERPSQELRFWREKKDQSGRIVDEDEEEIVINEETYGYLTSMAVYNVHKRRNISLWTNPEVVSYKFTIYGNQQYLNYEYRREKYYLTTFEKISRAPENVTKQIEKTFAKACLEVQKMVHAKQQSEYEYLKYFKNLIASSGSSFTVVADCPLKFKHTGNSFSIQLVKSHPIYTGIGSCANRFPNEFFFVLLPYATSHSTKIPVDKFTLEEGIKNFKVLRCAHL